MADTRFYGNVLSLWRAEDYADRQFDLNAIIPMKLAAAVHEVCWRDSPGENLAKRRSVTNVSSMSAMVIDKSMGQAVYAASKAALNILTMHLALELEPYSVRANAICPFRFVQNEQRTSAVISEIQELLAGTCSGEIRTSSF